MRPGERGFQVRADTGRGGVTGMPGAGDADGSDAARAEQHVQRVGHLCRARAAGNGETQAGHGGRVSHIQVKVHIQRPVRQVRDTQARDLAAADLGCCQVGDLGRVQVPGTTRTIRRSGTGRSPSLVAISSGR